ncbi:hypothetical protein ACGF3J_38635 [Streptomyces sp. NPDC048171]|uniref:hypothetical protein n=1 Tax=Streptomyces sp. NPDC048171 TaxID=3365504 RepID=UPI0037141D5F
MSDALRRIYDERWVVNRMWIMQHTGASAATVARWYAQREQYPEELRFPEAACMLQRTHYYDQEAVETFWNAWQADTGTGRLRTAGRRPGDGQGNHGGGWGRERREQAVAAALAALRQAGGYQRGMAAQLARHHGGNERGWQRAVAEARARYKHCQHPDGTEANRQPAP